MKCYEMRCDVLDKVICPGSRAALKEAKWVDRVVPGMVPVVHPSFGPNGSTEWWHRTVSNYSFFVAFK